MTPTVSMNILLRWDNQSTSYDLNVKHMWHKQDYNFKKIILICFSRHWLHNETLTRVIKVIWFQSFLYLFQAILMKPLYKPHKVLFCSFAILNILYSEYISMFIQYSLFILLSENHNALHNGYNILFNLVFNVLIAKMFNNVNLFINWLSTLNNIFSISQIASSKFNSFLSL